MSDWYDKTGEPESSSSGSSADMRAEFALIDTAMGKLPTITGNGGQVVVVNAGATALETTASLTVAQGGTGAATLTDGGILLGSGTGAVTAMSVLADGEIVIGDGTTDPVALAAFDSSTGSLKVANGGTGATTAADARTNLGLGSMATQAASNVAVTGGAIDGATIGGVTPGAITATTLATTGAFTSLGIDDNATAEKLQIADTAAHVSPNTLIGDLTTTPDGTLHVHTASAGSVSARADGDDIVVENSGDVGLTVLGPDANYQALFFGSASDNDGAAVRWNYDNAEFECGSNVAGSKVIFRAGAFLKVMELLYSASGAVGPMLFLANISTPPSTNPSSGGFIYCSSGALWYMGSSGTKTKLADA